MGIDVEIEELVNPEFVFDNDGSISPDEFLKLIVDNFCIQCLEKIYYEN
jgi:hypothetical protein